MFCCYGNFLANIPLGMKPTSLLFMHCDCQSALAITKNKTYNGKNRHIQLGHNLVKQLLKSGLISIDHVNSEHNLEYPLTKPLGRKLILETSRGMGLKPLANKSDGNPTFFIGDPMNKVHMGKNKSLVSSASTNIDLKSIFVYSYGVCESVRFAAYT